MSLSIHFMDMQHVQIPALLKKQVKVTRHAVSICHTWSITFSSYTRHIIWGTFQKLFEQIIERLKLCTDWTQHLNNTSSQSLTDRGTNCHCASRLGKTRTQLREQPTVTCWKPFPLKWPMGLSDGKHGALDTCEQSMYVIKLSAALHEESVRPRGSEPSVVRSEVGSASASSRGKLSAANGRTSAITITHMCCFSTFCVSVFSNTNT